LNAWLRKACAAALAVGCITIVAAFAARSCGHAEPPGGATAASVKEPAGTDTLERRVVPCMACHGKEGRATSEGYYPRIAGKPAGYLFNQLVNFRTGRRHFPMMVYLTFLANEGYLEEMAQYFASQHLPYPPPTPPGVGADVLDRGRTIVMQGDAARHVPSCSACHGKRLLGVEPAVPGLLGLSRDYLVAQLTAWQIGARSARPPDCMAEVVRRLSPADLNAATAWLASQVVPADAAPEATFEHPPPLECGSITPSAQSAAARPAPPPPGDASPASGSPETALVRRGRELVTLGDCHACHTALGGAPFAGGRAIPTPFGTFYSPNITPDEATGIGRWTAEDFWRALHEGVSRDGRPLYPTFPYTNYTRVTRADSDTMFAYLRTLRPVAQRNAAQEIRFPYDLRALLVGWRLLYFKPGVYQPDPRHDAQWNRGAYLVQGLGHCSACHEARNALGAIRSSSEPAGGLVLSWYAPSLRSSREAGVQGWPLEDIVSLLATGQVGASSQAPAAAAGAVRRAVTMGPMAEVVHDSLQFADPADLRAMAVYLRSLPDEPRAEPRLAPELAGGLRTLLELGRRVYLDHCADCHGKDGEGRLPAGPPLAGNRVVTMVAPADPIRILLFGGYPPGTRGNPRPFGMPPFYPTLSDDQIADVLTYIRMSWGNAAPPVLPMQVGANRGSPLW
jgi:cytochrome c553